MDICATCRFFFRQNEWGGRCRRYPHQYVTEQDFDRLPLVVLISGWYQPWVTPDDTCGEHTDAHEASPPRPYSKPD